MPRQHHIPHYPLHPHRSGQARIRLGKRDVYLGKHGTAESHAAYDLAVAEWLAGGRGPARPRASAGLSVSEVLQHYWHFAQAYYVKDGKPTRQARRVRDCMAHVIALHPYLPAAEFGPRALKAVRQRMVDAGWSRKYVNACVRVVVRMWEWLVSEEMVPADTHRALEAVKALRKGRTTAPERPKVRRVPTELIGPARDLVLPPVRAMIDLQLAAGMRPGEVCLLRPCDVDRSGRFEIDGHRFELPGVWVYRPATHKTEHHDLERIILLGPQAQQVLAPFLMRKPDSYCFDPREAIRHHAKGGGMRLGLRRSRKVGARYTPASYCHAVHRACDRAFPPPEHLRRTRLPGKRPGCLRWETTAEWRERLGADGLAELKAWRRRHRWGVHRLRKNAATSLKAQFGWEVTRVLLGHRQVSTTQIYAEELWQDAARAVASAG